jgi:signal transduction histidine kinase
MPNLPADSRSQIPFYRRKLIVRSRFQYGVVAMVAIAFLLGSAITQLFYALHLPSIDSTEVFSARDATWIAVGVAISTLIPCLYFTLVLSNRLAGPIFRLIRHMDEVARGGSPNPISFRSRDFNPDLAETYNRLLARIPSEGKDREGD